MATYLDLRAVEADLQQAVRIATMHREQLASPKTAQQVKPLLMQLLDRDEAHIDFLRTLLLVNAPMVGDA